MIVTWVVYTLLVSALLALGARGLEEACRAGGVPVRFVWVAALASTLALAALAPIRAATPGLEAALPAVELSAVSEGAAVEVESAGEGSLDPLAGVVAGVRRALAWPIRVAAESAAGRAAGAAAAPLGVVWLALSLALLVVGTATSLRYRRARRRWPRRDVCGTAVRVSPAAGPAVLGVLRPEIVVPAWLLERSAGEQRLVVLHEREHLRGGDALTLTFGWLAAALVPWNPLMWWMLSRLRLAVELDCDARVLRQRVGRQAYGSMLIEIAGRGSGLFMGVPALAGSPSNLERRLLAMTTTRFSRTTAIRAAGLGAIGALALVAACEARMPTSAEIEEMDAASARAQAERLFESAADSGVTYFVDGQQVPSEEALAIGPDRLARVEVVRGAAAGGKGGIIRLTTKSADASVATDTMAAEATDAETGERRRVTMETDTPFSGIRGSFDGLMLIDGEDAGPELEGLDDLRPSDIELIEVIKGPAATRLYDDPRAANGVILVVTKKGAGPG